MILLTLGLGLMLAVMIIIAAQREVGNFGFFIGAVGLVYLIDIPLMLWLFWRICTEFSARTNLKQFILAFKFYVGSFALVVIAFAVVFMAIDLSAFTEALAQNKSPDIEALMIAPSLFSVSLLIFALAFVATILSFVFYLLGIAKITEVSVREPSLSPAN